MSLLRTLALALLLPAAAATAQSQTADAMTRLGGAPCADAPLICVTLPMPFDHGLPGDNRRIDIRFGLHPATGPSRGLLFYATGGPGSSGIALAEGYLAELPDEVRDGLDIVFWEQRGTGAPYTVICPRAQAAYDLSSATLVDPQALMQVSRTYVTDCRAELPHPEILPYLSTDQAIRDLEGFRQAIGAPRVIAYGESYGTQFMQQYVAAFPGAVDSVTLAGVLDLTLPFEGYYASYTTASEAILTRLLRSCDGYPACAADMGAPAAAVFARVAAALDQAPATVGFPMPDGSVQPRQVTARMWSLAGFYGLYTPEARGAYLSALSRAGRGDLLPFLRLAYANGFLDSATLTSIADETQLPAAYFAILCSDFSEGAGSGDQRAQQVIASARAFAPQAPRLLVTYYADRMVCAYWPDRGDPNPRPAYPGGAFPTLILTADADPITPAPMAYDVAARAANASLVSLLNGPHVILGQPGPCPDALTGDLWLTGTAPGPDPLVCVRNLVENYVQILQPQTGFDLAAGIGPMLRLYPELAVPGTVGCNHGGTMTIEHDEDDFAIVSFAACALWPGLAIDGTAAGVTGPVLQVDVTVSGLHTGRLSYQNNALTGTQMLRGLFDGQPVTTPLPLP